MSLSLPCHACRLQAQGKEGRFFLAEPGGGAGFDPGVVVEKDGLPHSEPFSLKNLTQHSLLNFHAL